MKILIIPKVKETYKNQIEFSVEVKLINFLKIVYPKSKINIAYNNKIKSNYSLIIFSGGNNIKEISKKKNDKIRDKLDKFHLNYSLKNKIPIIGICHGAQLIAKYFKSKIIKSSKHTKNHKVFFLKKKKSIKVNSYHNYIIYKTNKKILPLARAMDNSIELYKVHNKKILGMMWHPERYIKYKKLDIDIFKKFLCN